MLHSSDKKVTNTESKYQRIVIIAVTVFEHIFRSFWKLCVRGVCRTGLENGGFCRNSGGQHYGRNLDGKIQAHGFQMEMRFVLEIGLEAILVIMVGTHVERKPHDQEAKSGRNENHSGKKEKKSKQKHNHVFILLCAKILYEAKFKVGGLIYLVEEISRWPNV